MKINKAWIVVALLLFVILYLAFCRGGNSIPVKPVIQTVPEQIIKLVKDSVQSQHIRDSMQSIQDALITENERTVSQYNDAIDVNANLHETNDYLLSQLKASELTDDLKKTNELIKAAERKKDSAFNSFQSNFKKQIKNKDGVIAQLNKDKKNLKTSVDTCLKNQTALTNYINKIEPKRELTIAARVISTYTFPLKPNIGVELGYRNKKGMEISAGYYTNKQVSIGIKKTFLRF